MLHFRPVSLIFSYTNISIFTRIHNFSYIKADTHWRSLWTARAFLLAQEQKAVIHTHLTQKWLSFYLGRLALNERTALRHLPEAEEEKGQRISWITPNVSEVTDAIVKSGCILENSLILHKTFTFCLASTSRKIPPTFRYLGCNLEKLFMRFGLIQTQLHSSTLIQM